MFSRNVSYLGCKDHGKPTHLENNSLQKIDQVPLPVKVARQVIVAAPPCGQNVISRT